MPNVIFYCTDCTIGYRSAKFCQSLLHQGFPQGQVRNGSGILLWSHEGSDLIKRDLSLRRPGEGESKAARVHVFGKDWDFPSDQYESVRFGPFDMLLAMIGWK